MRASKSRLWDWRAGEDDGETPGRSHRVWQWSLAILLGSALAVASNYWGRAWLTVRAVRNSLPAVPDGADATPQMGAQVRAADRAVREKPTDVERIGRLGQVYHANLFYAEAATCYELAEQYSPYDFRWSYYRGILCYETGRNDRALEHFQQALSCGADHPCIWLRIGDAHLKRNELDDAAIAYRKALTWNSHARQASFGLARVSERQGDWARVIQFLAEPAWQGHAFGPAYRLLATAYREVGRADAAERLSSLLQSLDPGNALPLDDPAIEELEDLSCSTAFLLKQASLAAWSGKPERQLQILSHAVEVAPHDLYALLALAECCVNTAWQRLNEGRSSDAKLLFQRSLELAQQVLKLDALRTRAHIVSGVALQYLQREDEAISCFRNALKLDSSLEEPYHLLGTALAKQGKLDEAERLCRRGVELNPNSAQACSALGLVLAESGRWEESLKWYMRARAIAPQSPSCHCDVARALEALGRQSEATALLREVIQRWPDHVPARELLRQLESKSQNRRSG